jgi:hypothetical protein
MSKILVAEDQEVARLQDAERRGRAGPAAFDEAVKHWPDQKLTLRQGIMHVVAFRLRELRLSDDLEIPVVVLLHGQHHSTLVGF